MWAPDTGAETGYSASLEFQREYRRTKKERQVSRFTHCLSVPERDRQFFKKLLAPLLETLKGRLINFDWEDMSFLRASLELPLKESLPQVVNQVGIGGWKDFAEIIAIASSDIQIGIIGLLLGLPNLLLFNELAAMFLPPDTTALSRIYLPYFSLVNLTIS
jgi:hypothetical protein